MGRCGAVRYREGGLDVLKIESSELIDSSASNGLMSEGAGDMGDGA